MTKALVLRLSHAAFGYDGPPIVSGVDLAVAAGDFLGIVGPNGAGKTTLFRGILGLLAPIEGLIALVVAGRRSGSEIGRVAAAFAIANAATCLFGRMSPVGKTMVDELLAGEILGIGKHEFETLAVLLALVLLAISYLHRDLLVRPRA